MERATPKQAAILVGGLGTRLKDVVRDKPKPLAHVAGRPFLAYLLDQLGRAGIKKAVLCTGYLARQVEEVFGNAYKEMTLVYSVEHEPLGTGGALAKALDHLEDGPVLAANGDSYCEVDIPAMAAYHRSRSAEGTLLTIPVDDVSRYGRVCADERGAVTGFEEKNAAGGKGFINAGIYLLERSLLESIPKGQKVSLEREVFGRFVGRGLYAFKGGGRFIDIGTPESYAEAQRFFAPEGSP